MTEDDRIALGKRIKETREYLGLTQEGVAQALGLPRSAISDIENGKRRMSTGELKRMSSLFKHPISYFLGEEPELAPDVAALARTAEELSRSDREELLRFAKFLEFRTQHDRTHEGSQEK